ncbi:MAG: hypothetical protein RJA10_617, partial [Pseudomonadota bacterium]
MPQPLSVQTLWQLDRLGAPALSPDGQRAVCTVTRHEPAAHRSSTSLWLFHTHGRQAPRRLTSAPGRHGQPAWSPRGDRIAFISQREQDGQQDQRPQLYLIAPDGGEALRASDFAPGIEAFRWMPDGRSVLFSAWVWPQLRGAAAQARRWKAQAARKETGYVTSEAQYRHWDHHHPAGRVLHLHRLDLASGRVSDLFEGTEFELPRDDSSPEPFDASPDGHRVAFSFDPGVQKVSGNRCALAEMDLRTRRVRRLADDADWHFELPRYAPDGHRLAMLASNTGRLHTLPARPALVQWPAGKPGPVSWRALGGHWDHEAGSAPRWQADGKALFITAEREGRCPLWRCSLDEPQGRFEVHTPGGWVQGFDVGGPPGAEVVLTLADAHTH